MPLRRYRFFSSCAGRGAPGTIHSQQNFTRGACDERPFRHPLPVPEGTQYFLLLLIRFLVHALLILVFFFPFGEGFLAHGVAILIRG